MAALSRQEYQLPKEKRSSKSSDIGYVGDWLFELVSNHQRINAANILNMKAYQIISQAL